MKSQERVTRRLSSVRRGGKLVDAHYEEIRQAAQRGDIIGWHVGESPGEIFEAAGIYFGGTGNWAAYLAARHSIVPLLEAAEAEGFPDDMCPYFKALLGYTILMIKGELDGKVPEEMRLGGPPKFLFCRQPCSQGAQVVAALQYYLKIPAFVMDVPFSWGDENQIGACIDYLTIQLQDLISFIEQLTGRPYPWHKLQEKYEYMKQEHILREEISKLTQPCTAQPIGIGDWLVTLGPGNTRKGMSVEFLKRVKVEVEERIAQGISSIPKEKFRLLWHETMPWYRFGIIAENLAREGILLCPGCYALGEPKHDRINSERPLTNFKSQWYEYQGLHSRFRVDNRMIRLAADYKVDGLVFGGSSGCKEASKGAYDMAEEFQNQSGIPVIVLNANHGDPRGYTEADVEEAILNFVQTIKTRERG